MPTQFLKKYLMELEAIFNDINGDEFKNFIDELTDAYEREANIFIFGNGGSGTTASHFASDLNKGVWQDKKKRFKVICLNDNIPIILAYANDISYNNIFVEQLKNFIDNDDLVIGVSTSGKSENVLQAIKYGNENNGKTFGICGCGGGKLKTIAQKSIIIKSNDMQKIEDMHVIIFHCVMQCLNSL